MNTTELSTTTATQVAEAGPMDLKLEVVILPVSDAERAKQFYSSIGWREDADFVFSEDVRVLRDTTRAPPGGGAPRVSDGSGDEAAVAERRAEPSPRADPELGEHLATASL